MKYVSLTFTILFFLGLQTMPCFSQPQPAPGCEPRAEIRKTFDQELDGNVLGKMALSQRVAYTREVLEKLIAKYPGEVEPYNRLIAEAHFRGELVDQGWYPSLQERFRKQAAQSPDDPLALYLAGVTLFRTDTPESLRLLETAKAKAPKFPWPALALAEEYSSGKHQDRQRSSENLSAYFALCPASMNDNAQVLLERDEGLQTKVAKALRARLAGETEPALLENYEMLWSLEFRAYPPLEHDALRKRIAEDLKRVKGMNPHPDSEWLAFLIRGYQRTGADVEKIRAMENQLLREYPQSDDALDILRDRWHDSHKKPEDEKDIAAWAKYRQAYKDVVLQWVRDFPDDAHLAHGEWLWFVSDDDSLPEKDSIAAMEEFLSFSTANGEPGWKLRMAAEFLLERGWESGRALELLQQARVSQEKTTARVRGNDDLSIEEQNSTSEQQLFMDLQVDGQILKAAKLAGRPDAVRTVKLAVDGPPPASEKYQSDYWRNRARLAAIENRKQDALAYYQMSLHTRLEVPQYSEGKFHDELVEEAQELWKETGGTPAAWAVWSQPFSSIGKELTQGYWEKPTKNLPAFELSDLSGKTWRLRDLEGKTLLINLWATWCGPCKEEMPRLQKLYEQLRGRPDIQILTFDIDEDVGMVAPFLKDKGYTFPVLPAYSLVFSLLDGFEIPQSWVVDAKGKWVWTRKGYGSEDNWAQSMTEKLDSTKAPAGPTPR
ncbi:MAG: TlpA disulfide reductase family protein [Candidatus Sulfotelmatobacter sp.]|jgi:thiol-disulfide isomerase/thioredoxin